MPTIMSKETIELELKVKKYKDQGDIAWEYNPLRNLKDEDDKIVDFQVSNKNLGLNLENPIDIELQSSYDGSTNIIFNDDKNPPRIVNSRVALLENNRYKVINRNQIQQTNLYKEEYIDQQTRLFRNITRIPKIQFKRVDYFGQLKAGNYTFYIKYADADYNETDIVCESGIVSVFKGEVANPSTCTGAYMDELTDKSVSMYLKNIDTSFTYIIVYFCRTTCDQNGILIKNFYKIDRRYEIENINQTLTFNGFEELKEANVEDINIQYNYVESVKTQAQVKNRLFFANVSKLKEDSMTLKNLALNIMAAEIQDTKSIGFINFDYTLLGKNDITQAEYYSPYNIYYKLGYFPGELYRLGIVFIYNDDHLSPVYNLRGIDFNYADTMDSDVLNSFIQGVEKSANNKDDEANKIEQAKELRALLENSKVNFNYKPDNSEDKYAYGIEDVACNDFLDNSTLSNTRGIFKFSKDKHVINYEKRTVNPIGIKFIISDRILDTLVSMNIKGFYFVRQQRIPTFLFSGLTISVDAVSGVPCLVRKKNEADNSDNPEIELFTESFINSSRTLTHDYQTHIITSNKTNVSGLLSVDVKCDKQMQSLLNSDKYKLVRDVQFKNGYKNETRKYMPDISNKVTNQEDTYQTEAKLMYIPTEIPQMIIDDNTFKTKAALQEEIKTQQCFGKEDTESKDAKLVRGIFTDFVGTDQKLKDFSIYNVYIKNFSEVFNKEYFNIRINDNSAFYAMTDRFSTHVNSEIDADIDRSVKDEETKEAGFIGITAYRGDCFTYTTTIRMQRNFTSNSVPTNDTIVEFNSFKDNFNGIRNTDNWDEINIGDVNAVHLGSWITFKGLSNNNIGLRSVDTFNTDEMSVMGNPRIFYPYYEVSVQSSMKIPETTLYNRGYSTTLGHKRNHLYVEVPFENDEFDTRIMFSNVQVDKDFKNAYKIFQGLAYEDMDRQYGGIVKILPWGGDILAVFEHAICIVPVDEKALISTTTGQKIHMYGSGVLQKQMTVISDMYGSIWKDSIIRTPKSIYGVDTYAKKIWRLTAQGLELISDFTIQRFLNDEINLRELDKTVILGTRNVKTHFNAYKNDVMFTFYNDDKIWNICYNEVRNMWVTRYSWTPLLSENINNTFLSFDLLKSKIFSIINTNLRKDDDIVKIDKEWTGKYDNEKHPKFTFDVKDYTGYNITNIVIKGYYWDKDELKSNDLVACKMNKDTWAIDDVQNEWVTIKNRNVENVSEFQTEAEHQKLIYNNYLAIKDNDPFSITFTDICKSDSIGYLYYTIDIGYIPYSEAAETIEGFEDKYANNCIVFGLERSYTAGMIIPYESLKDLDMEKYADDWNNALLYSIFVHGRSNVIDEIDYFDNNETNQILPTKWYNKQEPFEFEFIVNDPKGIHKIFDNLVVISNNVEPESIEIEIIGDVYEFNKRAIYRNDKESQNVEFPEIYVDEEHKGYKTEVTWDPVRNEYYLNVHADCLNIKKYGRRLGNIYYNEDTWYFQIQPIYYKQKSSGSTKPSLRTTRVRDKFAKIRVKYKGDKLVIITALQTLMTQSYV